MPSDKPLEDISFIKQFRKLVESQNNTATGNQILEFLEELEDATFPSEELTWGNCKRGCVPSYLNEKGFCSPACERGAKRGE
jgi:hypothetical protein